MRSKRRPDGPLQAPAPGPAGFHQPIETKDISERPAEGSSERHVGYLYSRPPRWPEKSRKRLENQNLSFTGMVLATSGGAGRLHGACVASITGGSPLQYLMRAREFANMISGAVAE